MKNPKITLGEVPVDVFQVSSMSRSEKAALAARLRAELEQVRQFRRSLPPCPTTEQNHLNGATPLSEKSQRQCAALLRRLMSHKNACLFLVPVDAKKLNLPDYHAIIKHPMDLGTIKSILDSGEYKNPANFAADVRLTFTNATTYNPPANYAHKMAVALQKIFESEWKNIQNNLSNNIDDCRPTELDDHSESTSTPAKKRKIHETNDYDHSKIKKNKKHETYDHEKIKKHGTTGRDHNNIKITSANYKMKKEHEITDRNDRDKIEVNKDHKTTHNDHKKIKIRNEEHEITTAPSKPVSTNYKRKHGHETSMPDSIGERVVAYEERKILLGKLEANFNEMPNHIIDLLREYSENKSNEELEIDIGALKDETIIELERLMDEHLSEVSKTKEGSKNT